MPDNARMRSASFLALLPAILLLSACDGEGATESTGGSAAGGQGGGGTGGTGGQGGSQGGGLQLDLSHGEQGVLLMRRAKSSDIVDTAARAPDGGIFFGGLSYFGPDGHALVGRRTALGEPDAAFGKVGHILFSLGAYTYVTSLVPLPDGGVLAAGSTTARLTSTAFVARFSDVGELVPSFGTGGIYRQPAEYSSFYSAIVRNGSGEIYLATHTEQSGKLSVVKLNEDGQKDGAFAGGGQALLDGKAPRELQVLPDGRLLLLAATAEETGGILYRLSPDGTTDSTFGQAGKTSFPFEPFDLELNAAGEMWIAGWAGSTMGRVLKLSANGAPDMAFGSSGTATVTAGDGITSATALPDGGILLVDSLVSLYPFTTFLGMHRLEPNGAAGVINGSAAQALLFLKGNVAAVLPKDGDLHLAGARAENAGEGNYEMMTLALHPDGSAVTAFGASGLAQKGSLAATETIWNMAPRPDGTLIAAGVASPKGALAHITDSGLDPAFGDGGFATDMTADGAFAVDSTDRTVGTASGGNFVFRRAPDGSPDTTFGNQGIATLPMGQARGVCIDKIGRLVVIGASGGPLVTRLLDDGSSDNSFGDNGIVQGFVDSAGSVSSVMTDPDNKVVVSGQTGEGTAFIARLLEDGSPDTAFGESGVKDTGTKMHAFRLVAREGGGYLTAGLDPSCANDASCGVFVAAVTADGQLDQGFGKGGIARIAGATYYQTPYPQAATGLAALPDGRVVVTGAADNMGIDEMAVWLLRSDGTLDTTFDNDGVFTVPGKGRATCAVAGEKSVIVGGFATHASSGVDMATLRFTF